MKRKIITHARILTLNAGMDIIPDGTLVIENGRIKAITTGEWNAAGEEAEITDVAGMFVLPGWVNTHTHLPMTLFRGYADDLPLHKWLTEHIFPAEARWVTEEHVCLAVRLALVEMIKSGTTCFNDMYFYEQAIAEEAARAGMRGVVGESLIDFPTPDFQTLSQGIALSEALAERWQGHPLIHPAVCAHSPYTCSAETLQTAKRLTRREVDDCLARTGKTPAAYLHSLGLLDKNVVAAHGVWLNTEDIRLVADTGTALAHCPKSNLKLASGIARVSAYLQAGIPVGLWALGRTARQATTALIWWKKCVLLPCWRKGLFKNRKPSMRQLPFAWRLSAEPRL